MTELTRPRCHHFSMGEVFVTMKKTYVNKIPQLGQAAFTVPSFFFDKVGGGRHMWDIRLRDFIRVAYVGASINGISKDFETDEKLSGAMF